MSVPSGSIDGDVGGDESHTPEATEADTSEIGDALSTDPEQGLSSDEVQQRRHIHGENRVERIAHEPAWRLFLEQFRSPLIALLVVAAVIAGVVREVRDSVVIGGVLLVNAILGFVQEHRAQGKMAALQRMLTFTATVRRDGELVDVEGAELVPGDVIVVEAGDRIPADARIQQAQNLAVDESTLTGESVPVDKRPHRDEGDDSPSDDYSPTDSVGELFMGTTVVRGDALAIVTVTGMETRMGHISAEMHQSQRQSSPLEQRLGALATRLAAVALVAAVTVVGVAMLRGDTFGEALVDGVVLAVASIPEGLPAIVTVTLALAMRAMARQGAIVENLDAIHTLGATTVICTDKTGTLTVNQMTVRAVWARDTRFEVSGEGYDTDGVITPIEDESAEVPRSALEICALCNDAEVDVDRDEVEGDPTEAALLVLALKGGVSRTELEEDRPRIAEMPFSSARMFMATFHERDDDVEALVKGAPSVVLDRCATVAGAESEHELDDDLRRRLNELVDDLTRDGLRVLALARRICDRPDEDADEDELVEALVDLTLVALVGMEDPPRPEAAEAVADARRAGIGVKMITGDHALTARAIAQRLGVEGDVIEGSRLDEIDDDDLAEQLETVGVLARVSPEHKVRVIDALRASGQVVAMTGDGVNDAAALDRADVGVAMGLRGSEVAKEAGDVVLTDDRLETILRAVRRGRAVFDNILTFVHFNLATNLAALSTILVARVVGLPTPFTPLQVLWVNLIMDGPPAMALGADPPSSDVMRRPPRDPGARILSRGRLAALVGLGSWMATVTLLVFDWARGGGHERGTTMAFTTFVLFQVVNAVNVRNGWETVFSRGTVTNPALWIALLSVTSLQVAVVQIGAVSELFGAEALPLSDWLVAIGAALSLLVPSEAVKALVRRRSRSLPAAGEGIDR